MGEVGATKERAAVTGSMDEAFRTVMSAASACLSVNCAQHRDRARRMMEVALRHLGGEIQRVASADVGRVDVAAEDPVRVLAREMADLMARDYDDDPLAMALVERARTLGVLAPPAT